MYGANRDLHVLTHSCPTRRSSDRGDAAFFELIRDKEVLTQSVAEGAGETVATANAGEKTKTLKRIVRDHLDGADGRTKVERWVPKWLGFPASAYTAARGVRSEEQTSELQSLMRISYAVFCLRQKKRTGVYMRISETNSIHVGPIV